MRIYAAISDNIAPCPQIRGPRFDSGRRLQTKYALAAASATFSRLKTPQNDTEK